MVGSRWLQLSGKKMPRRLFGRGLVQQKHAADFSRRAFRLNSGHFQTQSVCAVSPDAAKTADDLVMWCNNKV